MRCEAYGDSNVGCVRVDNEDRIYLGDALGLFVVCDGMGGQQQGQLAAELAVAAIRYYIDMTKDRGDVSWPFGYILEMSFDANRLVTGIRLANRQVWRRAEESIEYAGMGTTIAAVLVSGDRAVMANIGDSRIYLYRDSELVQKSQDDTLVANMLRKGL